ncbi:MAG: hypothetical protein BWK80_32110 [Desulfobacteraceae bacterium IS3]|nr:MAG: hypothetical protein BWK80_32110 [Desulfobacteraceae bacterium IS3]
MEVQGNKFRIAYSVESATVTCAGMLDMRGKEGYKETIELFDKVVAQTDSGKNITLNVKELEFLNSSGITAIGCFIIKLRDKGGIRLLIRCSNNYSWQARSMTGLEKLMPGGLEIIFE